MTDINPAICLACTRLDRSTRTPDGGSFIPLRCAAYPLFIPDDILLGNDHRSPRGDEVAGLTFEQVDSDDARSDFDSWRRFAAV
jgi:hypothetical protein